MKYSFVVIVVMLAGSVALNAVLLSRRSTDARPAVANLAGADARMPANSTPTDLPPSAAPSAPMQFPTWVAPKTTDDMREVIAQMRAAGFPPSILRSVAERMVSDRMAAEDTDRNKPFWKWRLQAMDPRVVTQNQEKNRQREAMLDAAMGPGGLIAAMDPVAREYSYGRMNDDRIRAIQEIERDYREMNSELFSQVRGGAVLDSDPVGEKLRAADEARWAEIRAALSPEEYDEYRMRNSRAVNTVTMAAKGLDLTDEEFRALHNAHDAFDLKYPRFFSSDYTKRSADSDALIDSVYRTLGDARIVPYLEAHDASFRAIHEFSSKAGVQLNAAQSVALFRVQRDMMQLAYAASRAGENAGPSRDVALEVDARLRSIVGDSVATKYMDSPYGVNFRRLLGK